MKQLLILSGKGGTGKTTIASAFIDLLNAKNFADCDVDAPNLHLTRHKLKNSEIQEFYGSKKAHIDNSKCNSCNLCLKYCKFDAINKKDGKYFVDEFSCEGCGVCKHVCLNNAIKLEDDKSGYLSLYKSDLVFSTARLKVGRGNSGKLVSLVKKSLIENASTDLAIIDGSPGIGCPVIASISGVDLVLLVIEPSNSGISDMKRILKTISSLNTKAVVCVNKYDLSIKKTLEIEDYCRLNNTIFVGKIPYDSKISWAINNKESIISVSNLVKESVLEILNNVLKNINVNL